MRSLKLAEAGKARLVQTYDEQAAAAYTKVAVEHSASPHVEDASARLAAMNLPIPNPTPEQAAASVALENSRRQYRLQDRAKLMILRRPDVVMAARDGEPPLTDPKPTLAPNVFHTVEAGCKGATKPNAATAPGATKTAPATADAGTAAPAQAPAPAPASPHWP